MVGQGLLYIRMKMGFEFVLNEQLHTSDSDPEPLQKELVQPRTSWHRPWHLGQLGWHLWPRGHLWLH